MIKVDLHNYEAFALDYAEGRLDGDDLSAFKIFLENHPEIKGEIDSLNSEIIAFESNSEFGHKTELKKEALLSEDINEDNYQTYFVAYYEGDLSKLTQDKVLEFVKLHPDKPSEFESFAKLRFKPDISLHFPLKRQIKKSTPILVLYRGLRIAASVAIILGLGWYFTQLNKNGQQYTERPNPVEVKKDSEPQNNLSSADNTVTETVLQSKDVDSQLAKENISKRITNVSVLKDQSDEYISDNREAAPQMASVSIKGSVIDQQVNSGLKYKTTYKKEEIIAEEENVFKIKLPKLFKRSDKEESKEEPTTLARAKISFSKKNKNPDQKTYVDLGPFKVYKKKGISANASNLNESKEGL